MLQSRKFDPQGAYIRRWLPALGDAGIRLGETYPRPMVEHGDARRRALVAYPQVKASGSFRT